MLEIENLQCCKSNYSLFHSLSFRVSPSEIVQVVGENGSGKTTLLRAIVGLSDVESGHIYWNGGSIFCDQYKRNVLYLGHQVGIKKDFTARENLAFYLKFQNILFDINTIYDALANVDLVGKEDVLVSTLSFGQQQKVALARLLLSEHLLWILDEPFTGLDKQGVKKLEHLLLSHANKGGMIIFTAHSDVLIEHGMIKKIELKEKRRR